MGIKRGKEYINCKELVEEEMIHCIVPLHLMTGSDNVSGFYGKGKVLCTRESRRAAELRSSWNIVEKTKFLKKVAFKNCSALPERLCTVTSQVEQWVKLVPKNGEAKRTSQSAGK